jgi:pimeloyl-ACP methyl ester carboxylesterase
MLAAWLLVLLLGGGALYAPDKDRAQLEAAYAQAPSEFVPVAGLRVHVRDSGPKMAKTIVLLHGFGASLHTWDAWCQELEKTYRVIRFDLPGAGLTGGDPSGDYSDARGVHILSTLLDELDLAQVVLVGHSMGGRLAWRLAAEQPHRVSQLVLIAPDGFASPGFDDGKAPEVGPLAKLMQYVLPKAALRMALASAYADRSKLDEGTVTRYHDLLLAPQVRTALLARLQQLKLQDPAPWLARISAPTLLLWGDKDALIPVANAQDYLRALPTAQFVEFSGVGHLPHEEAAAPTLPALLRFLNDAPKN